VAEIVKSTAEYSAVGKILIVAILFKNNILAISVNFGKKLARIL